MGGRQSTDRPTLLLRHHHTHEEFDQSVENFEKSGRLSDRIAQERYSIKVSQMLRLEAHKQKFVPIP